MVEEVIRASTYDLKEEEGARVNMTIADKGKQGHTSRVKLLVDSGDPIHIEIDPKVTPIQQERRPIRLDYVEKLNKYLVELKREKVIFGLVDSLWARDG